MTPEEAKSCIVAKLVECCEMDPEEADNVVECLEYLGAWPSEIAALIDGGRVVGHPYEE